MSDYVRMTADDYASTIAKVAILTGENNRLKEEVAFLKEMLLKNPPVIAPPSMPHTIPCPHHYRAEYDGYTNALDKCGHPEKDKW